MSVAELVVWSGMAGAILMLCLVAVADLLVQRSVAAVRGLLFILMMGGASVWASGLPHVLMPVLDARADLVVKASFGPLAGALALNYLGVWLGAGRDEPVTRQVLLIFTLLSGAVAVVLAFIAMYSKVWAPAHILGVSSLSYLASVLVSLLVSLRGAKLGDHLARWMSLACLWLIVMVAGLSAKMMGIAGLGIKAWALTAFATVLYFLIVIALTILRTREIRRLRQLALGVAPQELNIQIPQGAQLIPKVADAMWRAERLERDCVVAAIVVRNLYDVGEDLGHGEENQVLAVLAARIRRHVGFRNVVGLYHPRCFVMAVSSSQDPRRGELLVESLLKSVRERVRIGPPDRRFDFWPEVGMGVVELRKHPLEALAAINRAEQLALEDLDVGDLLSRPLSLDSIPVVR
ncbi:MAG: GGDEF domain-containing protein [Burkholderiaceae bacterium]